MKDINLDLLKKEIPYQWRVQSFSTFKPEGTCVAYIDARDAQDLLDEVCGPENWQDEYYQVKNTMVCRVGIKIGDQWVWKSDGGTETDVEAEKGELSDSFKRACVKWGIGRFLYGLKMVKVKASEVKSSSNKPFPVDNNGERIYDLTAHINSLKGFVTKPAAKPVSSSKPNMGIELNDGTTLITGTKNGKQWYGQRQTDGTMKWLKEEEYHALIPKAPLDDLPF